MVLRVGLASASVGAALAGCTTLPTPKLPRAEAPICQMAAQLARQDPPPGACARLTWGVEEAHGKPAPFLLCSDAPGAASSGESACFLLAGETGAPMSDRRGELAQLLACGRNRQVMVEDIWRFGEDGYQGSEVLTFDGHALRARWRGGVLASGGPFQELILESPATTDGEGCGFELEPRAASSR